MNNMILWHVFMIHREELNQIPEENRKDLETILIKMEGLVDRKDKRSLLPKELIKHYSLAEEFKNEFEKQGGDYSIIENKTLDVASKMLHIPKIILRGFDKQVGKEMENLKK